MSILCVFCADTMFAVFGNGDILKCDTTTNPCTITQIWPCHQPHSQYLSMSPKHGPITNHTFSISHVTQTWPCHQPHNQFFSCHPNMALSSTTQSLCLVPFIHDPITNHTVAVTYGIEKLRALAL